MLTVVAHYGVLVNKIGRKAPHFLFSEQMVGSLVSRQRWEQVLCSELQRYRAAGGDVPPVLLAWVKQRVSKYVA